MNLPTTIGVELEFVNQAGTTADLRALRSRLEPEFPTWGFGTDGSCGLEFRSPILRTEADLAGVEAMAERIRGLGFRTNERCGLHVHVDVRQLTDAQRRLFMKFFVQFEDLFFGLCPDRRSNTYCKPIPLGYLQALRHNPSWSVWTDRYHWMNGQAFARHGTCEFRLMGGSLNTRQIMGWMNLLLHIYSMVVNGMIHERDLMNFEKDNTQSTELLHKFAVMLHLDTEEQTLEFDTPQLRTRAGLSKEYLFTRWEDVRSDTLSVRAERRRRRLAAWKGEEQFEPLYCRPGVTTVE
jgi:hypothetical protein